MKKIFIYPGQGAQKVGMGKEFINSGSIAENIWREANDILGYDLKEKVINGPASELKRTEITQPAVYITEIIILKELLDKGIMPAAAAGHSLGEYAAVVTSGALSWQEGLELVKFRGELFEKTASQNPGGMLAVIGLKEDILADILKGAGGIAEIVNYNSPGQLVVSAEKELVGKLRKDIKAGGAKLVIPLKVSGGFHSTLMSPAVDEMRAKLDKIHMKNPQIKLYANVTGESAASAKDIRNLLVRQVNSPVRWVQTINNIINDYKEPLFIEAGPGKVLRGLIKRISRREKTAGIISPADIEILKGGDK